MRLFVMISSISKYADYNSLNIRRDMSGRACTYAGESACTFQQWRHLIERSKFPLSLWRKKDTLTLMSVVFQLINCMWKNKTKIWKEKNYSATGICTVSSVRKKGKGKRAKRNPAFSSYCTAVCFLCTGRWARAQRLCAAICKWKHVMRSPSWACSSWRSRCTRRSWACTWRPWSRRSSRGVPDWGRHRSTRDCPPWSWTPQQ